MAYDSTIFPVRFREALERSDIRTQEEFAKRAGIRMGRIERAIRDKIRAPKADIVYWAALLLDVSADWLLGLSEQMSSRDDISTETHR